MFTPRERLDAGVHESKQVEFIQAVEQPVECLYTRSKPVVQPVVKPVRQPVVSCKRRLTLSQSVKCQTG